jgi:protease I
MHVLLAAVLVLVVLAAPLTAAEPTDRVLILLAKGYNSGEFWLPYRTLQAGGYGVDVAGPARGTIEAGRRKRDQDTTANLALTEVDAEKYLGLVIPGGYSPGNLEKHAAALDVVRAFEKAGKPIAAICHGPRLLMRAGVMETRVGTCLAKVKNELADNWKGGGYGRYVDRSVVVHQNVITSRYPGDLTAFGRAMLAKLHAAGGPKPLAGRRRVVIIADGFDGHRKWVFRETLKSMNIHADVIGSSGVEKLLKKDGFDPAKLAAAVVIGKDADKLVQSDAMTKIVDAISHARDGGILLDAKLTAFGQTVDDDEKIVVKADGDGEWLKAIVTAAGKVKALPDETGDFTPLAAIVVKNGFDDRQVAAAETALRYLGYRTTALARTEGWLAGKEGIPLAAMRADEWSAPDGWITASLMGNPLPIMAMAPADEEKLEAKVLTVLRTLGPVVSKAHVEGVPLSEASSAVALRKGFDGRAAVGMMAVLASRGHSVAIVHHRKGKVRGINGIVLDATATYDETGFGVAKPVVVAPGSYWPEKTDARQANQPKWVEKQGKQDDVRLAWILKRYDAGATLVTFGLDSLSIGKQPRFKGKTFAAPDQCVWSFGRKGGRYSGDNARLSTDRFLSCEGSGAIGELLRLADEKKMLPTIRPVDAAKSAQ